MADKDMEMVKSACAALMEHFDSVHIFTTRFEGDGTTDINWGGGNWFARLGQVYNWLLKQRTRTVEDIKDERKEDTDDDIY